MFKFKKTIICVYISFETEPFIEFLALYFLKNLKKNRKYSHLFPKTRLSASKNVVQSNNSLCETFQ